MDKSNLMTEGPIRRKLISFALNVMIGSLFQQLYNTVDSMIVGNFCGSNALAAVSSAGNLVFLVIGFFIGISVGSGVVISNFIGARNTEKVQLAVHSTVALGLLFSVLLTVIGVLMAPPVLTLMKTPPSVLPESITYFRIYFAGATGFVMYNTFTGILRAAGDSRHPLYYLIFSSVINVILDLILIAGFGMGVGAAAFATAISQLASALLAFIRLVRIDADYRIDVRKIRFDSRMTLRVLHYGFPSGLQNSVMSLSNVVIQSYINTFGEFAMAGIGAYSKIEGFAFMPITSFAMAITTFVGQNIGAGEFERTKKGIRFGLGCTVISCIVLGGLLMVFAAPLIRLFDSNPEVVAYGVGRAHVVSLLFFLCGCTHFMAAVLRGAGKPMATLWVYLICWCVIRVIVILFCAPFFPTIYLSHWIYPITWTISTATLFIIYRRTDLTKLHI